MLSASTNTFLRIGSTTRGIGALGLSEKDRDKMIHPCIGEEQVRGVGHQARRRHDAVLLRAEEIEVRLANLG